MKLLTTKNFWDRTMAGFCLVSVIIASVILSKYLFLAISFVSCLITLNEFDKITKRKSSGIGIVMPTILSVTLFSLILTIINYGFDNIYFKFVGLIYVLSLILVPIVELFKKNNSTRNIANAFFSHLIIAVPFAILNLLNQDMYYGDWCFSFPLFAIFMIIWVNDSFAYLFGILFGKHKLCEKISPKKTWEGFVGGVIGVALLALLFGEFSNTLSFIEWLIVAESTVVLGTFGDLLESFIKRENEAKDSGKIIPGHGGFYDRFDSLLIACPIYLILINILMG